MKILKNIPSMDDNAICRLFVNAQRLLLTNKQNSDAKLVLEAIKVEWEKRLKLFEAGNYKATTPENGVLSVVSYKVGNEGENPEIRQQMFDLFCHLLIRLHTWLSGVKSYLYKDIGNSIE